MASRTSTSSSIIAVSPEIVCRAGIRVPAGTPLDGCLQRDALVVPGDPRRTLQRPSKTSPRSRAHHAGRPLRHSPRLFAPEPCCWREPVFLKADPRPPTAPRWPGSAPSPPTSAPRRSQRGRAGSTFTKAGVNSRIDLGLHLLARWFGAEARRRGARNLACLWWYSAGRARAGWRRLPLSSPAYQLDQFAVSLGQRRDRRET